MKSLDTNQDLWLFDSKAYDLSVYYDAFQWKNKQILYSGYYMYFHPITFIHPENI